MYFRVQSGLSIKASEWGSREDPLVILMHGGGQTRHAWEETGRKLAESGFHAVAIDLRGHGESDWHPEGDYAIESYKEDLISILNELSKPASLVGASLGGMVALCTTGDKEYQDLCTSLIMVDIGIYPNDEGSDQILNFMSSGHKGFTSLEEASQAISTYLPHRKRPTDNKGLEKNLRLKDDGRYYWHWDPKFIGSRSKRRGDYKKRQKEYALNVSVPTLLIRGAMSNIVTEDEVKQFMETIKHAEFVEIEKAAHMIAGDRNDIFTSAVIDFLRERRE